jgi:hypothetical protein
VAWELKHSVIASASRQTVWEFVSNVANLARVEGDAVESMTLDGPFQTGSTGTTRMRGQEPVHWRLLDVKPPERATIEIGLDGAVVRFNWVYEGLSDGRTRLNQHIVLEDPATQAYLPAMEQHFAPNLEQGMARLAEEIARFAADQEATTNQ